MKMLSIYALLVLVFYLLSCSNSEATTQGQRQRLSIIQMTTGSESFFIAKSGGKILWRFRALNGATYDDCTGYSVLSCPGQLLVINQSGKIVEQFPTYTVFDPRVLLAADGILIYDTGSWPLYPYNGQMEGVQRFDWLRATRQVSCYSLKHLKRLWTGSEIDSGLPIGLGHGRLSSIRVDNAEDCIVNPEAWPEISVMEYNVQSGRVLRRARLNVTFAIAKRLEYDSVIQNVGFGGATARWTKQGAVLEGMGTALYGFNYNSNTDDRSEGPSRNLKRKTFPSR
jgi:hypothetical protein